ncbi:phosphatidylinositol 3,4,5-trisphosphate 5-phosphatase 2-like isoform X2 [Ptychodera flava]|uniref:phosphatidylinositol 3,4,5-trisphosphate 5-phosphatase 2-like isoform X2 n=1 Tax=Ptychodera flava TaxID=63121 RepID=UPI003969D04E
MASWPWYHGQLSRMKAEEELLKSGHDGSFLVRDSESMKGAYALCVLHQGKIHQYRIMPSRDEKGQGFIIKAVQGVQQQKYTYLDELIQGYGHSNNGLACGLTHPVSFRTAKDDEDDDQDTDEEDKPLKDGCALFADTIKLFQNRYSQLNLSEFDNTFVDNLKAYISSGLMKDIESVQCGANNISHLHMLLTKSAKEFQKQLDIFMAKMKIINQLFDQNAIMLSKNSNLEATRSNDLDSFLEKLPDCRKSVRNLEKGAMKSLQEVCKSYDISQEEVEPSSPEKKTPPAARMSQIPPVTFEVKGEGFNKMKMKLIIDMSMASLMIMKNSRETNADNTTFVYSHDKILQLIKSRSNNAKLCIKVDGSKRKEFTFVDAKKRETFCQLIQQMKNIHTHSSDIDQISVFIGTWNMGDTMPSPGGKLKSWIQSEGSGKTLDSQIQMMPHDLYVIGTQESIMSERDWVNRIKRELQNCVNVDFKTVAVCSLWQIRLVILVKPEHIHRISHVAQSTVKTGIANALGNKGAVAISFNFNGTSLCFINSHLTSGNEKCARRNQNYFDILKGLQLGQKEPFNVTNAFHHLFWFGDLNYRLENQIQGILRLICEKKYDSLLETDQLKTEQKYDKAFAQFKEECITFPPTYRYRRGSNKEYVWEKMKKTGVRVNVPSWTDRVLWKSYPEMYISNTSYGCTNDILTSDHHPVFATYDIGIITQFVSTSYNENIPKELGSGDTAVRIIFTEVEARVKTKTSNNKYCLEFQSICLERRVRSKGNRQWAIGSGIHDYMSSPKWTEPDMAPMMPIVPDVAYLEDQYVLVAVKSDDNDEYYGECILALKSKFGSMPSTFKETLSHQGEVTGEIKGYMHVKTDETLLETIKSSRRDRTYELVSFEEGNTPHSSPESTLLSVAASTGERPSPQLPRKQQKQPLPAGKGPVPPARKRHEIKQTNSMYEDVAGDVKYDGGTVEKPTQRCVPEMYEVTTIMDQNQPHISGRHSPYNKQLSEPGASSSKPPLPLRLAVTHDNLAYSKPVEDDDEDDTSYFEYPPGPPLPSKQPNRPKSPLTTSRGLPPLPPRPQPKQKVDVPPPLPPLPRDAAPKNESADYEALVKPKTISQWMSNIGLPYYARDLIESGWDNIEFIDSITDEDLEEAGIVDVGHKQRILRSIFEMKRH